MRVVVKMVFPLKTVEPSLENKFPFKPPGAYFEKSISPIIFSKPDRLTALSGLFLSGIIAANMKTIFNPSAAAQATAAATCATCEPATA
jgi:hypothetical protein